MKKIVALILLMCMALSLAACADNGTQTPKDTTPENTTPEITMQEIYDACQTEALLKNHESVRISNMMDGELWGESYLTKNYAYEYIPDEEFSFAQLLTDDACYYDDVGKRLLYLSITPDGVSDFASDRAEHYVSILVGEDALDQIIESVSEKDGRITVTSILSSKNLEDLAEDGVTSGKFEYVLDAKTREIISIMTDCTYEDDSSFKLLTEMTYDAEKPEMLKEFLGYVDQTENLRNVTVISNPGTDKEESKSIQAPKGLIIGLEYLEDSTYHFDVYTDAACTEEYDPFGDTDSDITVYIKWTEQEQTEEQ